MMGRALHCVFVIGLLTTVAGCSGNYRVVKRAPSGGIVALEGPQDSAREKAAEYMKGQCKDGYEVVEEGEAVVGSSSNSQSRPFIGPVTVTNTQTQDRREWRITYKCKGVEAESAELKTLFVAF